MMRTGATFADAAAEYLRYIEHDRGRKPSTLRGYRSTIDGASAARRSANCRRGRDDRGDRAVDRRLRGLGPDAEQAADPAARDPRAGTPGLRAAGQRGGRRREVPAARERRHRGLLARGGLGARPGGRLGAGRRDVPDRRVHRSADGRAARAPLARRRLRRSHDPRARQLLPRPARRRRSPARSGRYRWRRTSPPRSRGSASASIGSATTTWCSPARPAAISTARRCAAATRRRSRRAGLRPLRFHDLRHTFGTRMIAKADIRRVQEWMGHADIQTTMRYLHYAPRSEDAELVAEAFRLATPAEDRRGRQGMSGRLRDVLGRLAPGSVASRGRLRTSRSPPARSLAPKWLTTRPSDVSRLLLGQQWARTRSTPGTTWDDFGSSTQCVECMSAGGL